MKSRQPEKQKECEWVCAFCGAVMKELVCMIGDEVACEKCQTEAMQRLYNYKLEEQ